jgi:hypothetical protein
MTPVVYAIMCGVARDLIRDLEIKKVVSGGAAWADHVAIELFLKKEVDQLSLHFPAPWNQEFRRFDDTDNGKTANYYHDLFSIKKHGESSFDELGIAIDRGAAYDVSNGFLKRNVLVAKEADVMLAFTFNRGAGPKDGGTFHTWNKFLQIKNASVGYHYDLIEGKLWKTGEE